MSTGRFMVELDGPRFRWVFLFGERRLAKGRWVATMDEAEDGMSEFAEAVGDAKVKKP